MVSIEKRVAFVINGIAFVYANEGETHHHIIFHSYKECYNYAYSKGYTCSENLPDKKPKPFIKSCSKRNWERKDY